MDLMQAATVFETSNFKSLVVCFINYVITTGQ